MKNQKTEELLQKCREEQSDFLDLGNCSLREIPAEVFELTHLRRLNLGKRFYREGEWVNTKNKEGNNHIRLLPPELVRLDNLEELSVEGNPIAEASLLLQLPRLERLNIGQTALKALDILKELPGLKALNLKGLKLRSLRRLAEYNLPELVALEVSENELQQIEGLEAFPKLQYLNLSINRIREVEGLSHLKQLKALYLGLNRIREIKNLEGLVNLEILSFGYLGGHYEEYTLSDYYRSNFIRRIEKLEALQQLKKLDLSGNLILEISGLEAQGGLETLYLGHNQIEKLNGIQHIGKLRVLSLGYLTKDYDVEELLDNNELFWDNKPKANLIKVVEGIECFPELEYLSLDDNELTYITGLYHNTQLKELYLSSNQIAEIKNLEALKELEILNLFNNQIEEIENLKYLLNLRKLILWSNQIEEIKNLDELESLKYLDLDDNNIKEIKNLSILKKLESLYLLNNQIIEIKNLEKLSELTSLHLHNNQIKEIKNLEGLPNLKGLFLGSNQITEIKSLETLANLENLYLSSNQITEIKNLENLVNLHTLSLDSNQITEIKSLETLANLENLSLNSNQITEIKSLETLANLENLSLDSNQITEIKNLEALAELENLYLSSNQITEIKNLEVMANLKDLFLISNQITEIKNLEALVSLKRLVFQSNQIIEIKNLDALTNLQDLYLNFNQITEVKNLEALASLQILALNSNQITEIKNLETLTILRTLYLDSNQITEIKNLETLANLYSLSLDSNQITEIKNLENLANLHSLSLHSNQISEIKNLPISSNFERLDLSKNKIQEIKNLENPPYLQYLYLNENHITHTQALNEIPLLAEVQLSENRLSDFDLQLLALPNIMRLYVAKNKFVNIPSEITNLDNCLDDARAWFKGLEQESVENFEVKLMLVGNGRVGKTSVLKRLFLETFDSKEDSTHGIQLYEHDISTDFCAQPLRINAWDFGGQEIYHATHRLFMQSRALYLALWDWETENKAFSAEQIAGDTVQFRNYELTYWLDHARSLSWQSPLMVVQNKIDQHERKWPKHLNELQKRYDIINFHHISAATGEGISVLKSAMLEEFGKMPEVGMKTPAQWLRIKEKLLALKEENKTIPFSRYQNLCEEEGLDSGSTGALIRFLHNTGNLFYQPHLFQNQVILDQEWALEGLYALFQRGPFYKQLKLSGGRTSLEALAWPWQNYDLDTRKIFLSLMESCEICFKSTEDEKDPEYILTEFLPDKKEEKVASFWEMATENELFLKYQTNFFHPAFISRFIARAGRLAKSYDHIWRNGIWITFEKAHALIEAFPDDHQILIRVKGDPAILLFYLIHQSFKEIFYDAESVEMDISQAGKEYLRYQELKEAKMKGMKKVLSNSRRMVDLEKVEFFEEVLEARSEDEVKRKLSDIVPKPKRKAPEGMAALQEPLTAEALQQLKGKLKSEIGKDLEKALETANGLLLNSELKNELITIQGRYADLKRFMGSGRLSYEEFDRNNNQIRTGLIGIVDGIESVHLDVEKVLVYL